APAGGLALDEIRQVDPVEWQVALAELYPPSGDQSAEERGIFCDAIVSGIPLSLIPKETTQRIRHERTAHAVENSGRRPAVSWAARRWRSRILRQPRSMSLKPVCPCGGVRLRPGCQLHLEVFFRGWILLENTRPALRDHFKCRIARESH